jgi:hypothetical protein
MVIFYVECMAMSPESLSDGLLLSYEVSKSAPFFGCFEVFSEI